jgi:hypothetical protein
MALPFIPFVVGAVAGSVLTYLYNDQNRQNKLKDSAEQLGKKVKSFVQNDMTVSTDTSEAVEKDDVEIRNNDTTNSV